jgi:hypothetical protein
MSLSIQPLTVIMLNVANLSAILAIVVAPYKATLLGKQGLSNLPVSSS